jgi:hypothetical protein
MKNQSKSPVSKLVALGALLLLAATASSCGVAMPTAPDVSQTAVNQRGAGAASLDMELGDIGQGGNTTDGIDTFVPDPEIVVPTAGGRPGSGSNGMAVGHQKNKWRDRY